MDEILSACVNSFRVMASEAGVETITTTAYDLPTVRGDSVKLRQIFTNLISNAIKFTPRGGTVTVEAIRTNDGGVTVLVRDTGVGMTEEEISVALTPFGQVDGSHSRWREGTGLGLPIAKALIELHGGDIEVRSTKGAGTVVAVVLPSRHDVTPVHDREYEQISAPAL